MTSRSSPPARPARCGTRSESRGAAGNLSPAVAPSISSATTEGPTSGVGTRCLAPSISPLFATHEVRGQPRQAGSGRETEAQAPEGPEPAPVLAFCATCRQPIRRNPVLLISFCPVHGLSQPITFVPLTQRRLPGD